MMLEICAAVAAAGCGAAAAEGVKTVRLVLYSGWEHGADNNCESGAGFILKIFKIMWSFPFTSSAQRDGTQPFQIHGHFIDVECSQNRHEAPPGFRHAS